MSPLAILLLYSFATTLVSGLGFYAGYNNNNNGGGSGQWGSGKDGSGQGGSGQWGGGQGGSGQGGNGQGGSGQGGCDQWGSGDGVDPLVYMNTARQQCVVPTPVDPSLLSWFFNLPTTGADLSVPYANYYYKFALAEMFGGYRDLSEMHLKVRYDLNAENSYFVSFTGYGNRNIVVNCTLFEADGSAGSCQPLVDSSTRGTHLTMIEPSYAWAVYANETLGIVAAIFCFGEIDTGAASWAIYSRTGNEIDPLTMFHVYEIVTGQYVLDFN